MMNGWMNGWDWFWGALMMVLFWGVLVALIFFGVLYRLTYTICPSGGAGHKN